MHKFVGNCADIIDWYLLAQELSKMPDPLRPRRTNDPDRPFVDATLEDDALVQGLLDAKYNFSSAHWFNYEIDHDEYNHCTGNIDDTFSNFVGLPHLKSWVTRVDPGCNAFRHSDTEADLYKYLDQGEIIRYTCHMCNDSQGTAFFLADHFFHNQPNGNVYQWDDWLEWHGATNAGLKPHWLYSFWGLKTN